MKTEKVTFETEFNLKALTKFCLNALTEFYLNDLTEFYLNACFYRFDPCNFDFCDFDIIFMFLTSTSFFFGAPGSGGPLKV